MLIRLFLRFAALGLKFGLTLVVARTLGFDAVAAYGLAVAASVIASKLLGLGFSSELNRRLSLRDPLPAIHDARALGVVFCTLYLVVCAALAIAPLAGLRVDAFGMPPPVATWIALVALSEHAASETNAWVYSLHRPRAGSLLLFARTGAWAGVACAGLLAGAVRSIDTVFALWFACNACVVAASWRVVRAHARHAHRPARFDASPPARRMLGVWLNGLPFYAAGIVLSLLQYLERFLAGSHADAAALGRYIFVWSIANAVQAVAFSTVVVAAGPGFVRTLADEPGRLRTRIRRATVASAGVAALSGVAILAVQDDLFRLAHQSGDTREVALLAVLLASFVLRAVADVLWTAAIALRAGLATMLSMGVVAVVCVPAAWFLTVHFGMPGAALAHLTASVAIVAVLARLVARGARAGTPRATLETLPDAA
ncbi:polysaccharide biosynthesis protein [Burkholderia paludis]|uniref:lipopolysaccharide biosynthesis protein n=1 Tax=Burkholderia paludis TaxID=1506587 RepID=UPI0004DB768B|nr:polysaccharide biosynthesis protein [Burkholderia paludis]KFG98615.1 polysaccharide biosynthesis protein [Burkholderia paludis]